jgi:ethanolamine transporter EutH
MRSVFYLLGVVTIVAGALLAAHASGFIGDPSLRSVPSGWMFGGVLVSFAGAAIIFAARGPD